MPPKRVCPASDTPSLPTAFFPGSNGSVGPSKLIIPKKSAKKKVILTAPPSLPPKNSFFVPGSVLVSSPATVPSFVRKQPFVPRRHFLYDQYTDEPYAEWIGNEAVCLDTGEVLFESKRGGGFDEERFGQQAAAVQFDFSPPMHKHPKDPSISSQDLINAGILTIEDFKNGTAGLSLEAFKRYMDGMQSSV
jgi:hypothetical protein